MTNRDSHDVRVVQIWLTRLIVVAIGFVSWQNETTSRADDQPNILLIMADDIGIDGFGCYGGRSFQTPNIDQLASRGMRFTHAYSQPLCTPTRVQLMTGRYNHRNWICFGILDPQAHTFGHLMRSSGYRTAIAGKWQLQSYDPPDFPNADQRRGIGMKVEDAGFHEWSLFHAWETEDKGSRYATPSFDLNGEIVGPVEDDYGPDTSVRFILDFFDRNREQPTFVYYAMSLPHWPMVPTPNSEAWADPSRRLDESTEYFPDMVEYMDQVVGELVEGLDRLELGNDTLILFYSDNGTDARIESNFRGQSITGGKAEPLQTGIRVPLIAYWPGVIEPGQVNSQLVDASDFFPTIADLANASTSDGDHIDGISFASSLVGHQREELERTSCFFWYDPRPGWDKERFQRHIFALDNRFKVFDDGRIFDIEGEGFREIELDRANLSVDAHEAWERLTNVINSTMQAPISDAAQREVNAFGELVSEER